jgi:hypothetical protein
LAGLVAVLLVVPTITGWHHHDQFYVRTGHGYVGR